MTRKLLNLVVSFILLGGCAASSVIRTPELVGIGVVVEIDSDRDGDEFQPTRRALTHLTTAAKAANADFSEFRDPTTVALVLLSAELHPEGNNGQDRVEVIVKTIGPVSNRYRGRLVMTPMKAMDSEGGVLAFAAGPVLIDSDIPTIGAVRAGLTSALSNRDLETNCPNSN